MASRRLAWKAPALVLAVLASACSKGTSHTTALTADAAAELIRSDAKFSEPVMANGARIATRSLVTVEGVTQGVGPGLDPGEAEVKFTYRFVVEAPRPAQVPADATERKTLEEVFAPETNHTGSARLRRFEDGWHVARYRDVTGLGG